MHRTAIAQLALLALAMSVASVARPAQAGITYTLKDLGTLPGGSSSEAFDVNAFGQVAGHSDTASSSGFSPSHAFLSGPGGGPLMDLGFLGVGRNISFGIGVNAFGQVTGESGSASGSYHAFLSGPNGGPLKDLGTLGGTYSSGRGVNAVGQVAGESDAAGGAVHAFLSGPDGGALKDLGTLGGTNSHGAGVNFAGQVTGSADTAGGASHAFLSGPDGGALKDLGTLGGTNSSGRSVNADGQVTGSADTAGGASHAFLSGPDGGALKDLGTLGGTNSFGAAVNASGQVVGSADTAGGATDAFLYSGGQMLDLNDLIAPGSGFTLQYASGISDTGYITGYGMAPGGQRHAFLLTPVPEPSGLVLLATGAVGLLGYRAWRRTRLRA
jgi:probable HAF family extracellular repeat protein